MTLEELEARVDEVINTSDEAERRTKAVDLKLDMRTYKEERDRTEEENNARITALENDVNDRDSIISELRESNTRLADKYGKILIKEDEREVEESNEDEYDLDGLIKRFD